MSKKKAKLLFKNNHFEVVEEGDFVLCAISGKEIKLEELNYWNFKVIVFKKKFSFFFTHL